MNKPLSEKILGHEKILNHLWSLVERKRLPHGLLFVGPSGVGKKMAAKALAQKLVCDKKLSPCGHCGLCTRIANEQSESLIIVEPQQGVIRAEQAREVISQVSLRTVGKARLVVFDEAHKFNPQSANSLLKVLEDPPQDTYFVLISNSMENVLPTLRSRAQVFRFSALSEKHLRVLAPDAPTWLLRSSLGRADNLMSFNEDKTAQLNSLAQNVWLSLLKGRTAATCELFRAQFSDKKEAPLFCRLMFFWLREGWVNRYHPQQDPAQAELLKAFNEIDDQLFSEFAQRLIRLEQALARHAEVFLAYEAFFMGTVSGELEAAP